jgi:hypothetical protein
MYRFRKGRKPARSETARAEAIGACAGHLRDLRRAHVRPPPDVAVRPVATVRLVAPIPDASWCTSPAQLCAELAE